MSRHYVDSLDKERKVVWCRGDKCKVHWSGDGELYSATITKIKRKAGGKQTAVVSFDEYGSEDDEEVNLSELESVTPKRVKKRAAVRSTDDNEKEDSILSPRPEDEESERLRRKFEVLDREEELQTLQSPPTRTSWKTTSKRLVDDLTTPETTSSKKAQVSTPKYKAVIEKADKTPKSASASDCGKGQEPRSHPPKFQFTDSESEGENDKKSNKETSIHSGFEDEDFEKPRFRHSGNRPKVPLVLSAEDDKRKVSVPATINQYLWDYQQEGVRFLYEHYSQGHGAILGDDMGLGKTVQVIAFLSALLGKTGTKRDVLKQRPKFIRNMSSEVYDDEDEDEEKKVYLIVGPASVLYNWVDELETWGHFTIGKFHKQYKEQAIADLKREKLDIVVTTFETCRDNVDILNRFNWDAVIADEAHKIKGMRAEATQALKALRCRRRFGLTGTALQNHMKELWCILDWANPGCLGTVAEFEDKFEKVILEGQKQDATKRQLAHARKAKELFSELRSQWFLRRTKAIIADQLPTKEEQVVYCRPTPFQVDVYKAILLHPHIGIILTRNDPCPCKSGLTRGKCHYKKSDDGRSVNQLLFSYLQLLLKTANHVALLIPKKTTNENQRKQAEEICDLVFARYPQFRDQNRAAAFRTLSDPKYCGKMKVMSGLLKVFKKEKSKVLLFSLSTQLLDIIEHYLTTTGYEYRRLDGRTPDVRRVALVREFNRDPNIFLMLSSTRAGGVGLNMTGANVVIIYDPNWNPTHDLQAQDRVYRLGQGRDVRVFRLITMGTVEENIYLRQVYKQQLDRVAVSEENAKRLFHRDEIFGLENLFKLRTSESCLTMDILERNAKIETSIRGFHIQKYIAPPAENDEKAEVKSGKRGRRHNDEDYDVDYLRDSESESESESDEHDSDHGSHDDDDDAVYGDDVTNADDFVRPTKVKSRRRSRVLRSDSDSESGLPCGQPEAEAASSATPSDDDDGERAGTRRTKARSRCRECLHPTAGTSRTTGRHTCGLQERTKVSSTQQKKTYKRLMAKSGLKSAHNVSGSSDEERSAGQGVAKRGIPAQTQGESVAFGSVSDVFNQYGVAHRHENHKLVGASRAEDHMTRCAIQDVYELHQYSQAPAAYCQPLTESSEESDDLGSKPQISVKQKVETPSPRGKKLQAMQKAVNMPRAMMFDKLRVLIGQTPTAIRRQQFKEMAETLGEQDVVALAKKVVRCSDKSRQSFLRQFYKEKDPVLEGAFVEDDEEEDGEKEEKNAQGKSTYKDGDRRKAASQRKRKRTEQSARKRGCRYSSESESEHEGAARDETPQKGAARNVKPGEKREHRRQAKGGTRNEVEEKNITKGEKGTKAEHSTEKDLGKDTDSLRETQSVNPVEKLLDEFLLSDGEEKRKSAPRTPRIPKKTLKDNSEKAGETSQVKPSDTASKMSIVDDLFDDDDDVIIRKAPAKRKGPPTSERPVRGGQSDSGDDLFSAVSPAKRVKEGGKAAFGEDSLDTFERECKLTTPVLNATVDDDFLYDESDDDLFSDASKWKKNLSKKSRQKRTL